MKIENRKSKIKNVPVVRMFSVFCLLSSISAGTVGCAQIGKLTSSIGSGLSGKPAQLRVIPVSSQYVAALDADDVVEVMRRAGFSDQQILELGTNLRNALFHSGAAHIRLRDSVEAVFAIHGDYVLIASRLRGTFIYDVNRGWVKLGPAPAQGL